MKILKYLCIYLLAICLPFGVATLYKELNFNRVWERAQAFKIQILVLLSVHIISWVYSWIVEKYWKDKISNPSWADTNKGKMFFAFYTPAICFFVPATEELFFRAGLVLAFTSLSAGAVPAIILSGIFFGFIHLIGADAQISKIQTIRKEKLSDSEKKTRLRILKVARVITTSGLGIFLGMVAIFWGENSLWWCWLIHGAWNLVAAPLIVPLLGVILILIGSLIFLLFRRLFERVAEYFRGKGRIEGSDYWKDSIAEWERKQETLDKKSSKPRVPISQSCTPESLKEIEEQLDSK